MTYTPDTAGIRSVFTDAAHDFARLNSAQTANLSTSSTFAHTTRMENLAGEVFDRWFAEEIRKAKQRGARTERERIASLAEQIRNNHDVAECAAYVEGETGRAEAISRWETICDEPDAWLRGLADDPRWLEAQLSEVFEEGVTAALTDDGYTLEHAAERNQELNPYTEES